MSNDPPRLPLPDNAQIARALDLKQILEQDDTLPSIAEVASDDRYRPWDSMARSMGAIVGSIAVLETLHDTPHHDEAFDWSDVADRDQATVKTLLDLIEQPGPVGAGDGKTIWEILGKADAGMPWLDDEYRTIIWRIVRMLALHPNRPLDRRCKPERLAAAVVWVALDASGGFLAPRRRWKARDLWDWFGVSSCTKIGCELAEALAQLHLSADQLRERSPHSLHAERSLVANVELLHSRYRALLIQKRDQLSEMVKEQHARTSANRPIQVGEGNTVQLRSHPVTVRWAARGATDWGRSTVMLALGDNVDELELLALSVPDARRLISVLEQALNEPLATPA